MKNDTAIETIKCKNECFLMCDYCKYAHAIYNTDFENEVLWVYCSFHNRETDWGNRCADFRCKCIVKSNTLLNIT